MEIRPAMIISVRYATILRELTGKISEELEIRDGATIKEPIEELTRKYGEEFKKGFLNVKRRKGLLRIFVEVNDQVYTYPECEDIKLKNGDKVAITPVTALAGG
ncbi:MAG: MoaD/ThiS family protein [Candidatus Nezhaarchaeales archaeon]